jgi:phage shock protein A
MALLERVATLIRANLNELIDQAEEPEAMLRQVILDMQNQLLQVKTQVAVAVADHHLLLKKKKEHDDKAAEWKRKAELAVDKGQEDLARAAIDRAITMEHVSAGFDQQIAGQASQVDHLKSALHKLEEKLEEARAKCDLLVSQHRRARAFNKAGDVRMKMDAGETGAAFDRVDRRVQVDEAIGLAKHEIIPESVEDQFARLEKAEQIEKVLAEIKARRSL